MTHSHLAALALALLAFPIPARAGIVFGPVRGKPGESVRLVTHSETKGATIEKTVFGKTSRGTIEVIRDRELIWTFREPSADGTRRGMVRVPKLSTSSKTVIEGKPASLNDPSPLTGKMFSMTKAPKGDWTFELDGSVPLNKVRAEIEEMKIYLKRDWYPAREIKLGDSWEFDPAWVKAIIERDLEKAKTIGTMSLRQIRSSAEQQMAVIDVAIHSTGADLRSDGSETSATIELTGQVTVNLGTMLDESLTLKGTIITGTDKGTESTKMTLPITLKATKSFVRDTALP
ncbi:MAG: hypothetical protein NTW21_14665 [Verrucomicrobia bacterium]|nr:hypothetical protein [Verrucomicrobiota bacterium]